MGINLYLVSNLVYYGFINTIVFIGSMAILGSVILNIAPIEKQDVFYDRNGVILGFLRNVMNIFFRKNVISKYNKTNNICEENNQDLKQENSHGEEIEKVDNDGKKVRKDPNVIFIMSESFWDITKLEKIGYSKNPIKSLEKLRSQGYYGDMISSEFGGGTSNIEFEILTGNSMKFLPTGMMAFKHFVDKPMYSLASYFRDMNYRTIGLHSYKEWFWNREGAYENLGFNSFLSEKDFLNSEIKGQFISDLDFSKKILEELNRKDNDESKDNPLFLYGVTMQNHGPYKKTRYTIEEKNIEVTNKDELMGKISALKMKNLEKFESYVQGIHDADEALGYLCDNLEKQEEETIVMFFGDHLAMQGNNFSFYNQMEYLKNDRFAEFDDEDKLKAHSVPFVIWSNKRKYSENIGNISANFLGAKFLELSGFELPEKFKMLNHISSINPILSNRFEYNGSVDSGSGYYENLIEEYKKNQYSDLE